MDKLNFSIPANNQKIIELYNKIKKGELDPSPSYQRKLVWRKQHKFRFISTILLNFPFPEIYIAPGKLDTETLLLTDQIVDGQQRLTTIMNYIEEKEVFSLKSIPIVRFTDLSRTEKEDFLNYEISVRYLKNATEIQVREIFQRINSTEYSLNSTERTNAQWGDSEFICFAKQIVEDELDVDTSLISFKIDLVKRKKFLDFFHEKYKVFTDNDINRMLALQFILTLLATICEGEYFRRNDRVQAYIESYFEEFVDAGEIEQQLEMTIDFLTELDMAPNSYWFNKSNVFSLIIECYKIDLTQVSKSCFKAKLEDLEHQNRQYLLAQSESNTHNLPAENIRYFDLAKEAVNDKPSREYRGQFINSLLIGCKNNLPL